MTRATRERPILFSGEMVRAILDGRKTQTRRIVKLRDPSQTYSVFGDDGWPESADDCGDWHRDPCPYGRPGDRLWVRETWRTGNRLDQLSPKKILERAIEFQTALPVGFTAAPVWYAADGFYRQWGADDATDFGGPGKTRVSIHMPRWASRIDLEITGIRVERLNSISEMDALSEGVIPTLMNDARCRFAHLWAQINGGGSFDANPFVWVVEFKRVKGVTPSGSCPSSLVSPPSSGGE